MSVFFLWYYGTERYYADAFDDLALDGFTDEDET